MSDANKLRVTVHHPTDPGRSWDMELDGSHTPAAIVSELIEDGHVPRIPESYQVAVKEHPQARVLNMDQPLGAQNVAQDAHLRIIPATKAGEERVISFTRTQEGETGEML